MIAVDSSVVVAAAVGPLSQRVAARRAIAERPHIVLHAALESYSVLTRLPGAYRMTAADARTFVREICAEEPLQLDRVAAAALLDDLSSLPITGGAVYDAMIGATAAAAGARLLTFDDRATRTYALVGAEVELLPSDSGAS